MSYEGPKLQGSQISWFYALSQFLAVFMWKTKRHTTFPRGNLCLIIYSVYLLCYMLYTESLVIELEQGLWMLIEPEIYFTYFQLDIIDWLTSYRSSYIFSSFSIRQKFFKMNYMKLFMFKSYTVNICSVIPAHFIICSMGPIRCLHWNIAPPFFFILLLCRYVLCGLWMYLHEGWHKS